MKAAKMLLALAMVFALAVVASAPAAEKADKDDKEVTLKGELACAKCVLKIPGITKCTNAITVKEGDKDVVYLLDDNGGKEKYHKPICTDSKKGSVKGVITEKPTADKPGKIKPAKDGVKYDE
jgi:hypothetical protein